MKVKFQKIVLLLLVCLFVVHAKEYMKVANFSHMWGVCRSRLDIPSGNERIKSDTTISQLDYLQALGYTHVIYRLVPPEREGKWNNTTVPGIWTYNAHKTTDRYTEGQTVESLKYIKEEAEKRGLKIIPAITSLSHQEGIFKRTGTSNISNGYSYVDKNGNTITNYANPFFPGCALNPGAPVNSASLEIFTEQMRIIKAVWGSSFPEVIDLGFDELGHKEKNLFDIATLSGLSKDANGFSTIPKNDQVNIIVNYMDTIMEIASAEVNSNVKFLIWGDSFIPDDWGERYGWDNPTTGVLAELKDRGTYFDRTILSQWEYTALNGNYEPDTENEPKDNTNPLTHQKDSITSFFSRLGYKYILVGGESWDPVSKHTPNSSSTSGTSTPNYISEAQCMYEWIEAGLKDDNCIGFVSATWRSATDMNDDTKKVELKSDWINNQAGDSIILNHIAPILPYLLDNQHLFLNRANRKSIHTWYSEDVLQGCRFVKARQEGEWKKGVHYVEGFAFATLGSEGLESMSDLNRYRATWNPELTEFTISGTANDYWPHSESGLYAFTTRDDNFVFNAKIDEMNFIAKSGLYLRSEFEGRAKVIYLEYNDSENEISVLYGDENVRSYTTLPTVISDADHNENVSLEIRRVGSQVSLSATSKTQNIHLGTLPFPEGEIYVGLVSVSGNGNVTFSDISIEKPIDMTPINMLLLD